MWDGPSPGLDDAPLVPLCPSDVPLPCYGTQIGHYGNRKVDVLIAFFHQPLVCSKSYMTQHSQSQNFNPQR